MCVRLSGSCRLAVSVLIAAGLSNAALAQERLVAAMDDNGDEVRVYDVSGDSRSLFPFDTGFTGGVRVASGDITGDGIPDIITGSGPGIAATVRVFDGNTLLPLLTFEPYGPQFTGGVFVAAGDVTGDGTADIITGSGSGTPAQVRVFDGRTSGEVTSFVAYPGFNGGVRVGVGDVNGDGNDDIVTGPGAGGGPHVRVFNATNGAQLNEFPAFGPSFSGGIFVAVGDWNGDRRGDIIVGSGADEAPEVRVFGALDGEPLMGFFPYPNNFTGGVRVATGDVNGDGMADIITAPGSGGAPLLTRFLSPDGRDGDSVLAFDSQYLGGIYVANAVVISVVHRDGFE